MVQTAKFYLVAGIGIRSSLRQAVAKACFNLDIKYTLQEEKGWLSSTLFYNVSGEQENMKTLLDWINKISKE